MRSHTRGLEKAWKFVTKKRPYRCQLCGWRGWRRPDGLTVEPGQTVPPNVRVQIKADRRRADQN
jgi:hypothetical protein